MCNQQQSDLLREPRYLILWDPLYLKTYFPKSFRSIKKGI